MKSRAFAHHTTKVKTCPQNECLRLRVKGLDFTANQIIVREGKGNKDRITMFPAAVKPALTTHLTRVREVHQRDLRRGFGRVLLPDALAR
jgi:site-specific recombinase XerD